MSSYNPFSWAMSAVSSPEASRSSKKRKVEDTDATESEVTLESIMAEISALKESNERIESMLKILVGETKSDDEKEENSASGDVSEEDEEGEDEEENPEDVLTNQWLAKFEELKKYRAKHGDCRVARSTPGYSTLGRWVARQRSDYRNGKMTFPEVKKAKLDTIGFDWAPQTSTPAKKRR